MHSSFDPTYMESMRIYRNQLNGFNQTIKAYYFSLMSSLLTSVSQVKGLYQQLENDPVWPNQIEKMKEGKLAEALAGQSSLFIGFVNEKQGAQSARSSSYCVEEIWGMQTNDSLCILLKDCYGWRGYCTVDREIIQEFVAILHTFDRIHECFS